MDDYEQSFVAQLRDHLGLDDSDADDTTIDEMTPQERSEAAKKGWLHRQRARAKTAVGKAAHHYTKADYQILSRALQPHSEQRRRWAGTIASLTKATPHLLKAHIIEEKENAVAAVHALKALSTGQRPTPEQWKGLRTLATKLLLSSASMAATGDVTGTIPHLAQALAGELVHHAITEHVTKLGAGVARTAYGAVKSRRPPPPEQSEAWRGWRGLSKDELGSLDPADFGMLEDFIDSLAQAVRAAPVSMT